VGRSRTAGGRGDASAGHHDDAASLARLDVLGDSGKAALTERLWGRVIADDGGVLLTHFAVGFLGFFCLLRLGVPRALCLNTEVAAKVVEIVEATEIVKIDKLAVAGARALGVMAPFPYFGWPSRQRGARVGGVHGESEGVARSCCSRAAW
jgi:hypothetical protein